VRPFTCMTRDIVTKLVTFSHLASADETDDTEMAIDSKMMTEKIL